MSQAIKVASAPKKRNSTAYGAKLNLPGLHKVLRRKSGCFYYYIYADRHGAGLLASFKGSSRLDVEAQAARAAPAIAGQYAARVPTAAPQRTMKGLIDDYVASRFPSLAPSTQRVWTAHIDEIRDFFGDTSLKAMELDGARSLVKRWHELRRDHPRTADTRLDALVTILSWGVDERRIRTNIAIGIKRLWKSGKRASVVWTDQELADLLAKCSPEVARAVRLAALTGLRKGQVVALDWSDVRDDYIEPQMNQHGKSRGVIPLYPKLKELISELRSEREGHSEMSSKVVLNSRGQPWNSADTFDSSLRPALRASGVRKRFHDLRGTAATKMYEGGMTISQIAVALGWSEEEATKIARHYVDLAASSRKLAEASFS